MGQNELTFKVAEMAKALGISTGLAYELIRQNGYPPFDWDGAFWFRRLP